MGGRDESTFLTASKFDFSLVTGVIKTLIRGGNKKCIVESRYAVDSNKIKAVKQEEIENNQQDKDVTFISTNDILTSWFCSLRSMKYYMMVINLRNRLEGHTDMHAGNYENVLFYTNSDVETPILIRKSLDYKRFGTFKRRVTKSMPYFLDMVVYSFGIISNWSTFSIPFSISGCSEELHVPIYLTSALWASNLGVAIIYRRVGKELGVYYFGPADYRQ